MDDTPQWMSTTWRLWSHQISLCSQSPALWKLLTLSTQQLVNILPSQIWLFILLGAYFNSFSAAAGLHLWRNMMYLYLVPLREPQHHCHRTQSAGRIWTAATFLQEHKYVMILMTFFSKDIRVTFIQIIQTLNKRSFKSIWAIDSYIMWGPDILVQFLKIVW